MTKFKENINKVHEGKIKSKVRVSWSEKRAWHDEEVTISVRTENVKDNDTVELKIQSIPGNKEIDKISDLKIKKNKLDHKYKIDWKEKEHENKDAFVVRAVVKGKKGEIASAPSVPLFVDLKPPVFSA